MNDPTDLSQLNRVKKMEGHQILEKPKLGFSSSFKQAFKILSANPKFIFITILFNFPLLASLSAHHILLHPTFIQLLKLLYRDSPLNRPGYIELTCIGATCTGHGPDPVESFETILSLRFLITTFLLSATTYFLDLLNTIATVSMSAALYGGNSQLGFKDMVVDVKGPMATSLCAVLLASFTLLGLVALSTNVLLMTKDQGLFYMYNIDIFFVSTILIIALVFGVPIVVLLAKYVEWSAVWNMGIVVSILDNNRGYIAIGVASYLSRASRNLGFSLMMVFFVLKVFLWLPYVFTLWDEGSFGIIGNVVFVSLNCVGNIVMWVVLMVYFYDCKRELLVKKIDLEDNGKASDVVPQ